jgi:cellulose synthase/poly-beta-1,6-N-acetylglucosamine synthase-like glycosyltransferase
MSIFCWLAAAATAVLAFGWLGYPVVLAILARVRTRPSAGRIPADDSPVTVVVATREAPEVVAQRLRDLDASRSPLRGFDIVVGVDHTSTHAFEDYRRACAGLATLVPGDEPGGKACTLNAAVRSSPGAILVFADSHQSFARSAIPTLVACLEDPSVGAATGTLALGSATPGSSLLRRFWNYELQLRRLETAVDSVVAVTGAIYALRARLWTPLPPGLICDDLFVPVQVVRAGLRVVASPESLATDPRHFSRSQEFKRKVRTLTGMLQFCRICPWVLNPMRNRIWFQFVCHKLLRIATPYLLVMAAGFGAVCRGGFAPLGMAALGAIAVLGAARLLAPRIRLLQKVSDQAQWAGALLVAPVVATFNAARGKWDVW